MCLIRRPSQAGARPAQLHRLLGRSQSLDAAAPVRASTAGTFLLVWKDHFLNAGEVLGQRHPRWPAFPFRPLLFLDRCLLAKRLQSVRARGHYYQSRA